MGRSWWSLGENFELMPIGEDAGSVEDNMLDVGISLDDTSFGWSDSMSATT